MRFHSIYSDHTDTSLCVLASAYNSYKHRKFMDMTVHIMKSAVVVILFLIVILFTKWNYSPNWYQCNKVGVKKQPDKRYFLIKT